jgi:drug/metabolite transporter (DMT)-like permease
LAAVLCFAFYTLAARRSMPKDVPSIANTAIVLLVGAIFLLPAVLSGPLRAPVSAGPVLAL